MRLLTCAAVNALEARAIEQAGPGVLMRRAARAIAEQASRLLRSLPPNAQVMALVGPGNNGGDALLAALMLQSCGHHVSAVDLYPQARRPRDAAAVFEQAQAHAIPWMAIETAQAALRAAPESPAWLIIDGLFGIGLKRAISGSARDLVQTLNLRDQRRTRVLSVDLPSGLNADTGMPILGEAPNDSPRNGGVVRADLTVSLLANKPGLHTGESGLWCGQIVIDAIGVSDDPRLLSFGQIDGAASTGLLYGLTQARADLQPRQADDHKGRFGDVLVIRGAAPTHGAAILALLGAQAAGAGRLYLGQDMDEADSCATPVPAGPVDPIHPEFMLRSVVGGNRPAEHNPLGPADAIVIGCGLGQDEHARRWLQRVIDHDAALVLDADALNVLAADSSLRKGLQASLRGGVPGSQGSAPGSQGSAPGPRACVLTPHPLEAARLLACSVKEIQADRVRSAVRLARGFGTTVVLKGAGSVVAEPSGEWSINASGGPLLAVAGTGDVLAGVIGALLAQGFGSTRAARLGVWLHGAAADALSLSPEWSGGVGLPASHLASAIRSRINTLLGSPRAQI